MERIAPKRSLTYFPDIGKNGFISHITNMHDHRKIYEPSNKN